MVFVGWVARGCGLWVWRDCLALRTIASIASLLPSTDTEPSKRQERPVPKQYASPPAMVIDPKKTYRAKMETSKGAISIDLFADRAPVTVNNFVFLSRDGFYDDVIFHRVLDGFMAQGGDPTGSGRGGPGYRWDDEASALRIPHDAPGTLSMANAGPNSNGSQFFITFAPTPHLDGRHAVFGRVNDEESLQVLSELQRIDPQRPNRAIVADKINSVTIEER